MSDRVFIVDDDPVVRQFVELVLTQQGYKTSSAAASKQPCRCWVARASISSCWTSTCPV
jgi:DNA-binding response OmpR family regulator